MGRFFFDNIEVAGNTDVYHNRHWWVRGENIVKNFTLGEMVNMTEGGKIFGILMKGCNCAFLSHFVLPPPRP